MFVKQQFFHHHTVVYLIQLVGSVSLPRRGVTKFSAFESFVKHYVIKTEHALPITELVGAHSSLVLTHPAPDRMLQFSNSYTPCNIEESFLQVYT